jgi:hypothetical protein
MMKPKTVKTRRRYSIGEWYGYGFEALTAGQRFERAKTEIEVDALTGTPCPFQTDEKCNKKGGVCSLRLYEQVGDGPVSGAGPLVTTCPTRFVEDGVIFRWIGETILQTSSPNVLNQVGFLDRLSSDDPSETEDDDSADFIGRIDNVLVHPNRNPLDWCALELQAVYFSGKAMKQEFAMFSKQEHQALPFPAAHRRPDWRSSGPKRLLPQLQTKVPTIRTWGKKMAVVIDEAFFASLVGLEREKYLSNSEIAWFVVRYEPAGRGWKLVPGEVVFTKLDSSVKALTGGVPLSREKFEEQLCQKLAAEYPNHPLAIKTD